MINKTSALTVYYTVGLPGSGKTTWAYEQQEKLAKAGNSEVVLISLDNIRSMFNVQFNMDTEFLARRAWIASIQAALSLNWDVIIHDTNLNPKWVTAITDKAHEYNAHVIRVDHFLQVPLETCLTRNAERLLCEAVPSSAIFRMYEKWILTKQYLEYKETTV
jgi:tRNA uridine 5-carbamoylmethylation protein Kti12